jgi:3-oxoacyl-[acyl-carrier protein] reductase
MHPSLQDRVVLVTGGGRGLGRAMALALAEAGARVAVTGAREGGELREAVAEAERIGGAGRALAIRADVTSEADCVRAVRETRDAFDALHVLVNNAGRGMRLVSETFTTEPTRFWETPPDIWRQILDINVNGVFLMTQAAMPIFLEQGFGKIVNISTSDQTMVRRGYAPYGPSKAALEAMTRVWAADLKGTGRDCERAASGRRLQHGPPAWRCQPPRGRRQPAPARHHGPADPLARLEPLE